MGIAINEILIPKKLFRANVQKELEFDTPLADYCPDIARLIRVDCTPFAESCEIQNDKAVVNGKAVYDVLYETDYKNRLKFCSFTQDFSQSIPVPHTSATNITAFCTPKCERIGCKLLSPRRLIMKATLGTTFEIEGENAVKALAVNEDEETFFRKKVIGFDGKTEIHRENYRFSESLNLNQNEKSIGEIVFGNVTLQKPQISVYPGRAEIKTTALVQTLCEEENNEGNYYISAKTFPINIDYQNDDISDSKRISVELTPSDFTFTPELDQYGENRIIKTDFSVNMVLKAVEPKAYSLAEDVFEKNYQSTPISGSATLPLLFSQQDHSFAIETKLSEMTPTPVTLLNSSANENGASVEITENGITLNGNFVVTILADTAEGIYSFDHVIPYSQFFSAELPESQNDITAEVYPIEVITTLHSDGTATAKIIAGTKIEIHTQQEESFVTDVTKRSPKEAEKDFSGVIYRFPQKGEDLWCIAKSYGVSPERLSSTNPDRFDESGNIANGSNPILIKI